MSHSKTSGSSTPIQLRHEEQALALGQVITRRHLVMEDIRRRTSEIAETVLSHSRVMKSGNFTSTTAADLQRMAELYDVLFFDSRLLPLARLHGMSFRWSSRMTSAGGKTIRSVHRLRGQRATKTSYEIALSATLLFQTFGDLERPIRVTGHVCSNRMEAMQRILEHELIHLAEMLVWIDSNCAAGRFQTIAHRIFGHTEHKHDLVTQHERAAKKFNVRVGSMVSFQHEGRQFIGKVNRITRRATVLVPDAEGQKYDDGKSYRKFYVPLAHLSLLK
ncbi:MAG: hypothetical protein IT423_03075 [Pirellulaceae bacterium]|nr:hypothetical protein [Pirellulaceae bacterium]